MLVHYNIKNRFVIVIVSIVLGVEGGEGDASEEGPGAGCKVQTVPTRNDPATGCSCLTHFLNNDNNIDIIELMVLVRVSGSNLEVVETSLIGRVAS